MFRVLLLLCAGLSLSTCDITVPQDFSITLSCLPDDATSLSEPEYTWSFTSAQTQQQHTLQEKGKILNLRNINTTQEGQYKCVQDGFKEEDRMRLSRTFTIRVEEPLALREWQVIKGVAGNDVTLPCKAATFSSSGETQNDSVVWKRETKNGVMLLKPDKNTDGQEEDKTPQRIFWSENFPDRKDWAIKISQTKEEDAGMYHCVITNTSQTLSVELELEAPPLPRCFGHTGPWEDCQEQDSRSGTVILQDSLRDFSASMYAELKALKPEANLIFSPVSIALALYNLLLGARAETRTQLESALRLPPEFSCVHYETKKLKKVIKDTLEIASAIFYSPEQQLGEVFVNQSKEFYDAVPEKLTDDAEENLILINQWVAKKTNQKITQLMDYMDPTYTFILLNAVYFNGKWKTVFESTNKWDNFTTFSGELIEVQTLYSPKYNLQMGYNKKLQAEVAKFPLTGKNSLYILIPHTTTEKSFVLMENNINKDSIEAMISEMNKIPAQTAEVTLPKIKLTVDTQLGDVLKKQGLSDLFSDPNLCGIFQEDSKSFISEARHRAFLSLTEKGVEAAAATSISFSRSFSSFTALQPFVLILWSDEAAAPLFMGRIINPLNP
ncbi:plasma protease C1 inhibitor [Puntigrus tetrazona]|uniref:plasma protease C1 inhibitor n=1 Tax=Puntigrus tetrazona TaxID=1606681 RepID=UPI001C8A67F6|nr:plasma protease C1 inhibitor [Puntigrus tetrazona]